MAVWDDNPPCPAWRAVSPEAVDGAPAAPLSRRRAHLWMLVLEARAIPCRLEGHDRHWLLLVAPGNLPQALEELRAFEAENHNWPPPLAPPVPLQHNTLITLSLLALLGIFHNLTNLDIATRDGRLIDWLSLGNADAGAILAGEWWRAVTALTLHADGLHLLGNLAIGGFFIDRLSRELGAGHGWALVTAAGTLGNLANALLQPSDHRAVGLSTAVFGAVAILAVRSIYGHRLARRRPWLLPVAAALALLGLLGSGGPTTDIGAHLWGFAAGLGLGGLSVVLWPPRRNFKRLSNLLAGVGVAAWVIGAWLLAFNQ